MYAPEQESNSFNILDVDIRKVVPEKPQLSKEICLQDFKSLQHFLNLSRQAVDDNLRSHLNGILNKNETTEKSILKLVRSKSSSGNRCGLFIESVVYPEWQKRVDVIKFCQKEVDKLTDDKFTDDNFTSLSTEEKHQMMRIDPYTYKNLEQKYLRRNAQVIELQNFYNNEDAVESIITERSSELFAELCKMNAAHIKQNFLNYTKSLTGE